MFDPQQAATLYREAVALADQMQNLRERVEELVERTELTADLCEGYVLVQNCTEKLTNESKEWNKLRDTISYTKIPEAFMEEHIKTITTSSGFRVSIASRLSVGFQEDALDPEWLRDHGFDELAKRNSPVTTKEVGHEWLRSNGHGALIQETVNSSSLSAAVKRMIEDDNIEPPVEIFRVKPAPYTSVTRPRNK